MKRIFISVIVIAVLVLITSFSVSAATQPPATGSVMPEIKLTVPTNNDYKNYLGLSGGDFFTIPQIKANVVIVEVLSMYCPHCQASADKVNELYRAIENNPALKDKVKLIGIAAGNSAFEAEVFREKYNVPFPIFEDGDFTIHKAVGEVRTPYYIGVRIDDGVPRVFYSKLGGFEKADEFLKLILQLSGLK